MLNYNMFSYILQVFFSQRGGKIYEFKRIEWFNWKIWRCETFRNQGRAKKWDMLVRLLVIKMIRTIYIITNEDKVILSAFTTLEAAKNEIELNYSEFPENFNIEPCALNIDARFINEIKKEMGVENGK